MIKTPFRIACSSEVGTINIWKINDSTLNGYDHAIESKESDSTWSGYLDFFYKTFFGHTYYKSTDETISEFTKIPDDSSTEIKSSNKHWINQLVFSPDGKTIFVSGKDHGIKIVCAEKNIFLNEFSNDKLSTNCGLCISPDGKKIAYGNFFNDGKGSNTIKIVCADTGKLIQSIVVNGCYIYPVFSPDGTKLMAGSIDNKNVKIWDAVTYELLHEFSATSDKTDFIIKYCFTPDGQFIVLAHNNNTNMVEVRHIITGELYSTITPHNKVTNFLVFSPNGKLFAISSKGIINICKMDTWSLPLLRIINEGPNRITNLANLCFSPDSQHIVIASRDNDKRIQLFDVESGKLLKTFYNKEYIMDVTCAAIN